MTPPVTPAAHTPADRGEGAAPVPAGDGIGGLCDRLEEALVRLASHKIAYVNAPQEWGRSKVVEAVLALPEIAALIAAARERDRLCAAVEGLAEELGAPIESGPCEGMTPLIGGGDVSWRLRKILRAVAAAAGEA